MLGIGVIGYGYWGPNLVRNFAETPGANVVAVSDLRPDRLAPLRLRYPAVEVTSDYTDLLRHPKVDAVAIATPVATHFDLAIQALRAGKHVLVEKPMAADPAQALRMADAAAARGLVLMVGHIFVYTTAVRRIHDLVATGALGEIYYYDSVRVNLGLFQHDVNVIWDLAVHDLSIMDYVLGKHPCAVSATGASHVAGEPENIAYLTLFFPDSLMGHVHVNWLAPVKVRRTLIGGAQKMIVYDDIEPSEKVKVYDKGITVRSMEDTDSIYQMLIDYRTGDMWAPRLEIVEPLATEAAHFVECVESGRTPETDAQAGLRVVRILDAASRSMSARGRPVEIE